MFSKYCLENSSTIFYRQYYFQNFMWDIDYILMFVKKYCVMGTGSILPNVICIFIINYI